MRYLEILKDDTFNLKCHIINMEPTEYIDLFANKRKIGFFVKGVGKLYLTHCPHCNLENYASAVSGGKCNWCNWPKLKFKKSKK